MFEAFRTAIEATSALGEFTGIASSSRTLKRVPAGPTLILPGAFNASIQERAGRAFPLLWQHHDDEPVGVVEMTEDPTGDVVAHGKLAMDVSKAKEAYGLLKLGVLSLSVGFTAQQQRYETRDGQQIRLIQQARLMECSLCTFPADPGAKILEVHGSGPDGTSTARERAAMIASAVEAMMQVDPGLRFEDEFDSLMRLAARSAFFGGGW
jgi:HK97 family phage prohead protease